MIMDKVTEMVAHMIGIFHTEMEDQRMRDVYTAFKALKVDAPDADPISTITTSFKAPYDLGAFAPRLVYADTPPPAPALDPVGSGYVTAGRTIEINGSFSASLQTTNAIYIQSSIGGLARPVLTLEPPGSIAVITVQIATLFDDDLLLIAGSTVSFTDPSALLADLMLYQQVATTMTAPLAMSLLMPGPTAQEDGLALHGTIASFDGGGMADATEYVAHGTTAFGPFENGTEVDELARLDDVMPAYLKAKAGQEDDPASDEGEAHTWPDPFAGLSDTDAPGPYRSDIEAGNLVVAGGNTMINQTSIWSAWLDAPVIAVKGDVVHLNAIAQINLMVQHASGGIGGAVASTSINSAAMSFASTAPLADLGQEVASGPLQLPSNWAVTRVDGDLIAINHVKQFSFQTDHDRAEITFGNSNTFIGLGDNTIVNLTDLSELGFGYDLIMVGGAMISVNWVHQTNVLIDNDAITYSGAFPAGVHAGDNLAFNGAQITGNGIDHYAEMQTNFAAATDSMAAGGTTIGADVARDALFDGVDLLRVLFIEGDLTTINWLEQTNILGDSDQVHLALDNFQAATGAAADIITGSNALINLASITQYGTDSTVMVGGDVYDDALLYQAELIDTDADPLGTMMPALAPAAVAFLAEGMLEAETAQIDAMILPTPSDGHASPDLMQTMLG